MTNRSAPIIRTESIYYRDGTRHLSLVVACPYCDAEHQHPGGPSILSAHEHLGVQAAGCRPAATYDVTDTSALLPGSRAA